MEFYRSINNLKNLKQKILHNQVTEQEILVFLQDFAAQEDLNCLESNFTIFEIYYLLTLNHNLSPAIQLGLSVIPSRLIMTQDCAEATINTTVSCSENKTQEANVTEDKCSTTSLRPVYDRNELIANILKKYSSFRREDFPSLQYPPKGELGNVFFTAEEIVPGKRFHCEAQIDSEGTVLKLLSGPTEILEAESYEEIYAGLVGKLFEFQK